MEEQGHTGHGHPRWQGVCGLAYSLVHLSPPSNRMIVDLADPGPGDRVLDVGCGTGAAVLAAGRRLDTGRAIGVDPSPALLRMARLRRLLSRARRRVAFHAATADRLPLGDASVDVAWTVNSLHHWEDPGADLRELHRVLAPGGRLLVAEDESVHAPGSGREHRGRHVTADQVAGWLDGAGFVDVRVRHNVLDDIAVVSCRRPDLPSG
jgi:ubiquinone/menaquinone biosynthesis C-methylase UbiE